MDPYHIEKYLAALSMDMDAENMERLERINAATRNQDAYFYEKTARDKTTTTRNTKERPPRYDKRKHKFKLKERNKPKSTTPSVKKDKEGFGDLVKQARYAQVLDSYLENPSSWPAWVGKTATHHRAFEEALQEASVLDFPETEEELKMIYASVLEQGYLYNNIANAEVKIARELSL